MIVIERDGKTVVITGWRAWLLAAVAVVVTTAVLAALAFLVLGIAVSMIAFLLIVMPTGIKGTPAFGTYGATKAAVRNLVRAWTRELKDRDAQEGDVEPAADERLGKVRRIVARDRDLDVLQLIVQHMHGPRQPIHLVAGLEADGEGLSCRLCGPARRFHRSIDLCQRQPGRGRGRRGQRP
jgi:hypothetical protein